jgi:2-C-methyl-D-erythritol 2,4-cyclodiphosphate synthase
VKLGVRAADGGGASTIVTVSRTLPRESIFLVQTPQAFRRAVFEEALARAAWDVDVTDEAALVERAGRAVHIVDGDPANIKITTADDLVLAEAIAQAGSREAEGGAGVPAAGVTGEAPSTRLADRAAGPVPTMRIGTGYDLHRFVEGRPLVLGGVTIPSDRGLLGHSDADAICHAVTDAVLGAAGAGDIGQRYPDTDPRWRGASSLELLKGAVAAVRADGFQVSNVDVVVIAERPKIGPHVDAMRRAVAEALGVAPAAVSIKGKTNEGVGAIGRGEAIAVHASALLIGR